PAGRVRSTELRASVTPSTSGRVVPPRVTICCTASQITGERATSSPAVQKTRDVPPPFPPGTTTTRLWLSSHLTTDQIVPPREKSPGSERFANRASRLPTTSPSGVTARYSPPPRITEYSSR